MLTRVAVSLAALALSAGLARAQAPTGGDPKPVAPAPTAGDAPKPAPADAPEVDDEEATLRRRRRPRLNARLPEHASVVELRIGLHALFLDGAAQKDSLNLLGTRFEFDNDLDLDPIVFAPVADVTVHLAKRFSIVLDFFTLSASGSQGQVFATAYDGASFPAGAVVSADLQVMSGSIAARYFASSSANSTFEIEAGVRYVGIDFDVDATFGGAPVPGERETTDAFIPFVGFLGGYTLFKWGDDPFLIEGRVRLGILGIGDSKDNQTNAYVHAYLGLSCPLPPLRAGRFNVRLALGYEALRIDAEREDNQLDEDFEIVGHGAVFRLVIGF